MRVILFGLSTSAGSPFDSPWGFHVSTTTMPCEVAASARPRGILTGRSPTSIGVTLCPIALRRDARDKWLAQGCVFEPQAVAPEEQSSVTRIDGAGLAAHTSKRIKDSCLWLLES